MKLSNDKNLLRQIIIQHYEQPNNKIDNAEEYKKRGYISWHNKSATCIDDIEVLIKVNNNKIQDAKFFGIGCAISTASTDILCDVIKKEKDIKKCIEILDEYNKMINNKNYNEDILDELIAFKDIYLQTNRIKCSTIGVNAISSIIEEVNENNEKK